MRTKELLALGVLGRGSRMGGRVAKLLERGRDFSAEVSGVRLGASGVALLGCLIAGAIIPKAVAFAQMRPAFEVASVRAVRTDAHAEPTIDISGANLTMERQTVKGLVQWAYGVEAWRISGPAWLDSQDFDIRAKAAGPVSQDRLRAMLQTLLEDRFKLALHREQKVVALYGLTLGKGGPNLREVQEEPREGGRLGWEDNVFFYTMVNHVSKLAQILPDFLDGRPVEDRTGLTGVYEINLRVPLDPEQLKRVPQPGAVWTGFGYASGVFDAVEKLGLKLEARKAPVEVLMIDRVEKPEEN
jgi:uncharacterized protein (TIGR03435 family)